MAFDHRASADGLRNFINCVQRCPFVETTLEVSGTYDLIVQGSCASFAEYNEQLERIRPHLAEFASLFEPNFIVRSSNRKSIEYQDDALWLPCEDGHKQVQASMIDKVEAQGDYMRVYVGNWTCLVHETMHRLAERLTPSGFVRLNRSTLVRMSFIDRVVHDGRRWTAWLRDGSRSAIARSEVHRLRQLILAHSPTVWETRPDAVEPRSPRLVYSAK